MKRKTGLPNALNDEQGLSLILAASLVFFIVALTALVVDHLRLQTSLQQLQRAADAAALAGARQLDGRATSWDRARSAALDVLAKNNVYDYDTYCQFINNVYSSRSMEADYDTSLQKQVTKSWQTLMISDGNGSGSSFIVYATADKTYTL